jgi:hypothetical protein
MADTQAGETLVSVLTVLRVIPHTKHYCAKYVKKVFDNFVCYVRMLSCDRSEQTFPVSCVLHLRCDYDHRGMGFFYLRL